MRILVTGTSGLVGRSVLGPETPHEVFGLTRAELDVTDRDAVNRTLSRLVPAAVLHCAGFTDVDGAEREPGRARAVNVEGAFFVAEAAREVGARMVYLSTDHVFDGEKSTPYTEEDPPRPISHYGESKLDGENRVAEASPEGFTVVRSAWLYGQGKGFPQMARREMEKGNARFISDQVGSPTWAVELAGALVRLVERGLTGVYHFVNRGETSWLGLAEAVAEILGRKATLSPARLEELGRPAARPRYSALAIEKYERATGTTVTPWREALRAQLQSA